MARTNRQEIVTVTKKEMVRQIAHELAVNQVLVKKILQFSLESMMETVVQGGRLELRNFGVFEVKRRAARKARNPKTNQEVFVPAKRVITFRASKNVSRRLPAP